MRSTFKDLRVIINSKMTFCDHTDYVVNSSLKTLGLLRGKHTNLGRYKL